MIGKFVKTPYYLIIVFLFISSCGILKKDKSTFLLFLDSVPELIIPYSGEDLSQYYFLAKPNDSDELDTRLFHDKLTFNPLARGYFFGDSFEFAYKDTLADPRYIKGDYYYPLFKITSDSVYSVAFIYQGFEEFIPAIFVKLNTYTPDGTMINSLELDKRFFFEIRYYNEFHIIDKHSIQIRYFKEDYALINDNDELTYRDVPLSSNEVVNYTITPTGHILKQN